MVRLLQPWQVNIGNRLIKRPQLYLRDSGLLHVLLRDLAAHNKLGASWAGRTLEVAARAIGQRNEALAFWAPHNNAEGDLFWQEHGRNRAVEVKYADAPRFTRSMASAMTHLELAHLWGVYPGDRAYPLAEGVSTLPLTGIGPC